MVNTVTRLVMMEFVQQKLLHKLFLLVASIQLWREFCTCNNTPKVVTVWIEHFLHRWSSLSIDVSLMLAVIKVNHYVQVFCIKETSLARYYCCVWINNFFISFRHNQCWSLNNTSNASVLIVFWSQWRLGRSLTPLGIRLRHTGFKAYECI